MSDQHGHVVAHKGGFEEAVIRDTFEQAGLVDVEWEECVKVTRNDEEVRLFVAKGVKPDDDEMGDEMVDEQVDDDEADENRMVDDRMDDDGMGDDERDDDEMEYE